MKKKKAIFMDRDGVLNKLIMNDGVGRAPYKVQDLELFPGVIEACQKIKDSDFLGIIVTNQPDVARGWVQKESVEMINNRLRKLLPVDDIRICFHTNFDNCHCRKPKPGMLLEAASKWEIDLSKSFMIGDRYSDIAAGISAGCISILVGTGDTQGKYPNPHYRAASLIECLPIIF